MDGREADPSGCDLVLALENWERGEDLLGWAQALCSSSSTAFCWDAAVCWACDHLGASSLAEPWRAKQWPPWWICWTMGILPLCTTDLWTHFMVPSAKSPEIHVVAAKL